MTKEESIQGDFLNNFTDVLGYKIDMEIHYGILHKNKTSDRTKSDGALGFLQITKLI